MTVGNVAAGLRKRGRPGRAAPKAAARRAGGIAALLAGLLAAGTGRAEPLPDGFVRLEAVDATIRQDIRYAGRDNFVGRPLAGYAAPACILTRKAAEALRAVQARLRPDGFGLVVFDCYRPAGAVADMVAWSEAGGPPDPRWFPAVRRDALVAAGYVGARSAHSRGSAVDLALVRLDGAATAAPACGAAAPGMAEHGTGFDCFDEASRTRHARLPSGAAENRRRLVAAMREAGFRNYPREWWHFTLAGEPYPSRRFDFPVTSP